MKIIKVGLLFLTLISMVSCQQIIDNYWEKEAEENYVSPYTGVYVGTYDGADKGTLHIEITTKNSVIVKRTSTLHSLTEEFYGGMIEASFYQVKSQTTGFAILGNVIYNPKNNFTGTWKIDESNSGSWTLKKQ